MVIFFIFIGLFSIYLFISIDIKAKLKINQIIKNKVIDQQQIIKIGVSMDDEIIYLTDQELNQHTLVMGTTGSGKTTTLMNFLVSCCERQLPLIYVDGKGDLDLVNNFINITQKYKRRLKIFSLDPDINDKFICPYNPLAYGNFSEWKNKIITLTQEAEGKGQEHYSLKEQLYINLVCEILYKSGAHIDLEGFIAYLKNKKQLLNLANSIDNELGHRLLGIDNDDNDIVRILENFYYSYYGKLFSTSNYSRNDIISLPDAVTNGEVILFLLNSASYKKDTSLLGKLIINDINSCWSYVAKKHGFSKGYCIFDEFAAYASPNMASILSQQRSNGLHAIVATQSINAISLESNTVKRVAVELIANCNNFILHKLNDPVDIKLLANMIGKIREKEHRFNYDLTEDLEKANSLVTFTKDDYILNSQALQRLNSGFGYLYQSTRYNIPIRVSFNNYASN